MMEHKELFLNLYLAHLKTRKGKMSKNQSIFEEKLGQNLKELAAEILSCRYVILPSSFFIVTHPKPREIFSAHYRDRVVQRLVVDQLEKIYGKSFYDHSFACRKGKGGFHAIEKLAKDTRRISKGGALDLYYLQMDVESFFLTINRDILTNLVLSKINKEKSYSSIPGNIFYDLVKKIFLHDARDEIKIFRKNHEVDLIPENKSWWNKAYRLGIPIGNLTSQFGANLYLNSLDHYISRKLKPPSYLRYMDDLLILSTNNEYLKLIPSEVNQWLNVNRKLQLHPLKTKIGDFSEGMRYLGYECFYDRDYASCFRRKALKKHYDTFHIVIKNCKVDFTPAKNHCLSNRVHTKEARAFSQGINSRLAFLSNGESYRFRKKSLLTFHRNKNSKYLIIGKEFKKIKLSVLR